MGCSLDRDVDQIGQGEFCASGIEVAPGEPPAKHGRHLQVDQFRGCHLFTAESRPCLVAVLTVVSQRDGKDARVNDEHVRTGARPLTP